MKNALRGAAAAACRGRTKIIGSIGSIGSPSLHRLPLQGFNRFASRSSRCTCKAYSRELCTSDVAPPLAAPQLAMLPIKKRAQNHSDCVSYCRSCALLHIVADSTTLMQLPLLDYSAASILLAVSLAMATSCRAQSSREPPPWLVHPPADPTWSGEPWISFVCQLRRPLGSQVS